MVLSESAEFLYKATDYWYPKFERNIRWNDPQLAIDWGFENDTSPAPTLATKDADAPFLSDAQVFT